MDKTPFNPNKKWNQANYIDFLSYEHRPLYQVLLPHSMLIYHKTREKRGIDVNDVSFGTTRAFPYLNKNDEENNG
jgi:hypothetical protein